MGARSWAAVLGASLLLAACGESASSVRPASLSSPVAPDPPPVHQCLAEDRIVKVPAPDGRIRRAEAVESDFTETLTLEGVRNNNVRDDLTYDLRRVVVHGNQDSTAPDYNAKPVNIGGDSLPEALCVLAPYVVGQHSTELGWEYLKRDPGGGDHAAIRVGGTGWTLVDGPRVVNMMNGFRPVSDGLVIRNAFLSGIRDDCVENDDLRAVRVEDSLFDGCYTAFSQRPERGSELWDLPRDTSVLEVDGVLVHMRPMPGGHLIEDPDVETYSHVFKWSPVAGPLRITDSIIRLDPQDRPVPERLDWPEDVEAEDVTIVWLGEGPFPGRIPDTGVRVTTDVTVWDRARTEWLERHGCTDVHDCDTEQLLAPTPRS